LVFSTTSSGNGRFRAPAMYADNSFISGDTSAFLARVLFFINHRFWMIRFAGEGFPDGRRARIAQLDVAPPKKS
jgi:hypothetical protein